MLFLLLFFTLCLSENTVNGQRPPLISYQSGLRQKHSWAEENGEGSNSRTQNQKDLGPIRESVSSQLEYRLSRLERGLFERVDRFGSEIKEVNRRLQGLEWQSVEVHSKLDNLRNDLPPKFSGSSNGVAVADGGSCKSDLTKLESRTENLSKGIQLLVANMRVLNSDIEAIRNNITALNKHKRDWLSTKVPEDGSLNDETMQQTAINCQQIQKSGQKSSGIYQIMPKGTNNSFIVTCDLETMGGGWTVFLNRFDGSEEFYRGWDEYKRGFGNINGEHWLGLDNLHLITGNEVNELLIELEDLENQRKQAHYLSFSVGPEQDGYPLHVLGGYNGDAGDSLIYHAGSKFSTNDKDQDGWVEGNCAQAHGGAWWYRGCDTSNLNGRYLKGELPDQYIYQGMYWGSFKGPKYSLLKAKMMVRPKEAATVRSQRNIITPRQIFDDHF